MSSKASRELVIDASVARAAGGGDATNLGSKACRDFLLNALEICHRVVMTEAVKDEWKKHQSRFARTWLRSMYARKKVRKIHDPQDASLRTAVDSLQCSDRDKEIISKDLHLIEAAKTSGMAIVCLDETVRKLFTDCSDSLPVLKPIVWINPSVEGERSVEWLQSGAPLETSRQLCSKP